MLITRRLRSLKAIAGIVDPGAPIIAGITDPARYSETIARIGYSLPLVPGETILPSAAFGKSAATNANGWFDIHKDLPMETAHRQVIWEWKMKRGWSFDTDSRLVDVPYKRYPRTFHPPFGMELRAATKTDGALLLVLPELQNLPINELQITTAINMLVEIFGECSVFSKNLNAIVNAPIKRLNWQLLPPGKQPWEKLEPLVRSAYEEEPAGKSEVVTHRLEMINSFGPDFVAVGTHGFTGYLVFGFPAKGIHLLESIHLGNATYALGGDWEALSKRSKAELLEDNLHLWRIIHSARWAKEIIARMK